jgi:cytochrome c biogenesis factor
MMIHPPSLYTGYVSASVPFAFGIAALASGQLGDQWIRTTRRWALFSWAFLSLGNLLGARWAYEVLGWGGYWAWDPVENAAFMPWLVSTAYLHSVMIQEKKDMLRVWNMVLVLLTFSLTIFGTFLTRSGVISSVHSFTQSGLGPFFIGFLLFVLLVAGGLLVYRLPELRTAATVESFLSRESAFLFNNLVLVGSRSRCSGDGVPRDLGVGARREDHGRPAVLQPRERAARPRAPLPGRRRSGHRVASRVAEESPACLHCPGPLGSRSRRRALDRSRPLRLRVGDVRPRRLRHGDGRAGVLARRPRPAGDAARERAPRARRLVGKNRRRYGGYLIHVGSCRSSSASRRRARSASEAQQTLKAGEEMEAGKFRLRYERITSDEDSHVSRLRRSSRCGATDARSRRSRPRSASTRSRSSRRPRSRCARRCTEDLYLVLGSYDAPRAW